MDRHGHVVYESSQFRAGIRAPAVGKVDEIHNISQRTQAGAEVSDTLKYFSERIPATFVYAGIDLETSELLVGTRGAQIAGRLTPIDKPRSALHTAIQRPVCRRCTHAAGITMTVTCWTTHDRNVCLRHRLWIGNGIANADEQVDISRLPDTLRAQRHHRNLVTRHGRRWVRNAYPDARKMYFAWLQQSADPFDLLDTARRILTDGTGKAPSPDLTLTMVFHPQVVTLAGLLAGREWERCAVATGHVTWLVEQITVRNILLGYVPKDRKDPLIQWAEQHFSSHKFVAFHRSPRIYDAFFPRETIPPPRQPDEADTETRWSPFHPC